MYENNHSSIFWDDWIEESEVNNACEQSKLPAYGCGVGDVEIMKTMLDG